MKILIIDHYDSFSYNLVHLFQYGGAEVAVQKSDEVDEAFIKEWQPDGIVFSPGPGTVKNPKDIGNSREILETFAGKIPILGVCLGHQLMAYAYGGRVLNCAPAHGKKDTIHILSHDGFFKDFPESIKAMRYHSFCVDPEHLPKNFRLTAQTEDGIVMAFEDAAQKLYAVQFHPESVGTPLGQKMAQSFLLICKCANTKIREL